MQFSAIIPLPLAYVSDEDMILYLVLPKNEQLFNKHPISMVGVLIELCLLPVSGALNAQCGHG